MDFTKRLHSGSPLLLDGAMGTYIFQQLPNFSGCVELLNLERPDLIASIYESYAKSGADIISTNTFGANAIKLSDYNLSGKCAEINRTAAAMAKTTAAAHGIMAAGSMGPIGRLMEPMGGSRAKDVYDAFAVQARALADGGADLIIIETMSDVLEAKTALRASKEATRLPVVCSMTFEHNGKTLSGTDIITALATLCECGADAVGINCSMGPDGLLRLYSDTMRKLNTLGVPLAAWANAGLPEIRDGRAVYSMSPERFAEMSARFADMGARIIGGCCGTTPAHTAALRERLQSATPVQTAYVKKFSRLTSRFTSLDIGEHRDLIVIGERLNPTARKKFAAELKEGQQAFLRDEAKKQEAEGAHLLDINVGVPGIDERTAMRDAVSILSSLVKTPLMIDSDNPAVLESALRVYPGVGIINSINGKGGSVAQVLPLARAYGFFVVALCLDDTGIHRDAAKRIAIGETLLRKLEEGGIGPERVFIDPLMLAESAEPGAAAETLKVIEHFSRAGIKTSLGISNISFGLPARKHINNAFLRLAMRKGLSAAIANSAALATVSDNSVEDALALDFLTGADPGAARYIAHFSAKPDGPSAPAVTAPDGSTGEMERIYRMVIDGNTDGIEEAVRTALATHRPESVMNDGLIRGLEKVGDLYNSGEYFLPQMIASASAMKKGFSVVKPLLSQISERKLGKIVICTVRGDVHDIGKNIVAMMLENHGFEVIDLGRDVPTEKVMEAVRVHRPDILCLSSLLTTTMGEMQVISRLLHDEGLPVKLLIGGAVVNKEYADSIGAWYGEDAVQGVAMAKRLLQN